MLAVMAIMAALATLAFPALQDSVLRAKVARAIGDIRTIQTDLDGQDSLPASLAAIGRDSVLDPWGHPYQYLRFDPATHTAPPGARRDRFLVPINSTYDLYSMGADGATQTALTSKSSQDDIIRANDGGFIGLAWQF
jgi:general secretion pathway protein G